MSGAGEGGHERGADQGARDEGRRVDHAPGLSAGRCRAGHLRTVARGRRLRAGRERLPGERDGRAVRHHHAPAQRHRCPAPRARGPLRDRGPHDPTGTHAAAPGPLAARRRPCLDRGPMGAASHPRRRGHDPGATRARTVPGAHVALHGRDPARSSWASSAGWAARRTGVASVSPWTKARRMPCGSPSRDCTRTASRTGASASSTGARAAARASPTSRSSARPRTGRSGRSATTSCRRERRRVPSRPLTSRSRWRPRDLRRSWATRRSQCTLTIRATRGSSAGSSASRSSTVTFRSSPTPSWISPSVPER